MNKIILLGIIVLSGCQHKPMSTQQAFFDNMKDLCGRLFIGTTVFPKDPEHDFAGKPLIADFKHCEENQIHIGFYVGQDQSRTWQLTKTVDGLLFKHEHVLANGQLDEITNYGGWANKLGNEWQQYFPADQETADMIPAAATNVWMLGYKPRTHTLTYDLVRNGKPRDQAYFVEPVGL